MAKHKAYTAPSRNSPKSDSTNKQVDDGSFEDASRSAAEFVQNVGPVQKHKQKSKKIKKVFIALVVLGLFGAGGYFLYREYDKRSTQDKSEQQSAETATTTEQQSSADPTAQESYSSTEFNLSFDHPGNWQVDDSEEGMISVVSPEVKLTDTAGSEVTAEIVISIVPTSADMSDFPTDQATSVRESDKFIYDSPAAGQREETYLSFMNLDGPSEGLNAVYITGDNGYVKGDPVTKADFESVEPIIGIRFMAGAEDITVDSQQWDEDQNLMTAFAILKSLNIK